MDDSPFRFVWPVDQAGYDIERRLEEPLGLGNVRFQEARGLRNATFEEPPGFGVKQESYLVIKRGGPLRFYWPLDEDGLWLQFAHSCTTVDGVSRFVNQFGTLAGSSPEPVDRYLETAARLRKIAELLQAGNRGAATKLFSGSGLPTMKEAVFWYDDTPEVFEFRLVPLTLRDGLLHQAGEAITGNRRFRRCRNEGCPNWFRLGPRASSEGRVQSTITIRREFCSDRCRVAYSRRRKLENNANA